MDRSDWKEPSRQRDPGALHKMFGAWRWWLVALSLAAFLLAGVGLLPATPSYRAEAQVLLGPRTSGLIGLRSHLLYPERDNGATAIAKSQMQLVSSRDLARRAIKELGIESKPEFDPLARGLGPGSRALVLLGLKRDPARMSLQERILQSYEDRLSVSARQQEKLVTIGFQSEDRVFAADAANRIADLFLEMRSKAMTAGPGAPDARIVARASAPGTPVFPGRALFLVFGLSATVVTALGTIAAGAYMRTRPQFFVAQAPDAERTPLRPLPVLVRLDETGTRGPAPMRSETISRTESGQTEAVTDIVELILTARRGPTGTCVLVTSPTEDAAVLQKVVALGRELGHSGRSIIVGLGGTGRDFAHCPSEPLRSEADAKPAPGFADIAAGRASFAEVIRRDPVSRLHILPAGQIESLDPEASSSVIEALAKTYDFVLLLAPPVDQDETARILAAKADVTVLATAAVHGEAAVREAREELTDHGARKILMMGVPPRLRRPAGPSRSVVSSPLPRAVDANRMLKRRAFPST